MMENVKNEHRKENMKMDKNVDKKTAKNAERYTEKNTNKKNFKEEESMQEQKRISRLGEYRERLYDLMDELQLILYELDELQEEMEEDDLDHPAVDHDEDESEETQEGNAPQVTVCFFPKGCEFMIPVEIFGGLANEH